MNKAQPIPHNPMENPEKPELVIDLHDGSNEQVSIIIVHHNRPEYLVVCLQSIHFMSNLNNYEVIVVDNATEDSDTVEFLEVIQKEGVKVIRNNENLFWSAAANRGAALADKNSKYLIFMHCDTVVLNSAWIDTMINISEAKGSGIVGNQLSSYLVAKQQVQYIPEWCVMFTRDCWEDIGPWPEELPLVGHSFIMTVRAQYRGYKPTACTNNLVHHYRAISFDPNKYEQMVEKAMAQVPKLMQPN
jgi:GT2 family glycosyltransferase